MGVALNIIGVVTVGTLAACLCVTVVAATIAACRMLLSRDRKEKWMP